MLSERPVARCLSYAHLHALYFGKLLLPVRLCYDYGYPCVPHVEELADARNCKALALYAALALAAARAARRRDRAQLSALSLLALPFLPAAQLLLPVGTLLGERLLYLSFWIKATPASRFFSLSHRRE